MGRIQHTSSFLFLLTQGLKIELGHRQLTVDFVNQVALQLASADHDDRLQGDKIDYAERLGQMNKRYQMLATDIIDRQKKLEALELQWEEYERGLNNMYSWFEDRAARIEKYSKLGHETSVRNALKDCQVSGIFHRSLPWGSSQISVLSVIIPIHFMLMHPL